MIRYIKEEIQNTIKIKSIMRKKKELEIFLMECPEIRYAVAKIKNLVDALKNLV